MIATATLCLQIEKDITVVDHKVIDHQLSHVRSVHIATVLTVTVSGAIFISI